MRRNEVSCWIMSGRVKRLIQAGLLLLLNGLTTTSFAHSYLILHAYSQEYGWTTRQHQGFVDHLRLSGKTNIISTEYLDTKRRAYDADYGVKFAHYLRMKYTDYHPDLIYVTDDNGLTFARDHLISIFPGVPIVFSGVNNHAVFQDLDTSLITGVFEKKEILPNIEIMDMFEKIKGPIVFVGDESNTYRAIRHDIEKELKKFPHLKPRFISSRNLAEIVHKLLSCKCRYVTLTTVGGIKGASGQQLSLQTIISTIANTGDFALFSMEDAYLFDGVIGGFVTSGEAQGKKAAELAEQILHGIGVSAVSPVTDSPNRFIFDARELERFSFTLPEHIRQQATILHAKPGFYHSNRTLILGILFVLAGIVFFFLVLSVIILTIHRKRQRVIEGTLLEQKAALEVAQDNLNAAQRLAHIGSWGLDLVNNKLIWSDEIYRIFEIDKVHFGASYEAFLNAIHPDDREVVNQLYTDSVKNHTGYEIEHRLLMPDGRIKYVQERGITRYSEEGVPLYSDGTVQDITRRKQDESKLRQWASIFESTIEAVIITDLEQKIIDVNRAYTEITGFTRDEVLGQRPNLRRSHRHDKAFYQAMWDSIDATGSWSGEIWNRKKSGELSPELHSISVIRDENDVITNYLGVFTDISVLKHSEEQLEHLANHDPLTGLANRSLLNDRLESSIRRLERDNGELAVLFLDLDRFKKVNDSLGHPVGDLLLQEASQRLERVTRGRDTVGRLGGDEFLVIVDGYQRVSDIKTVVEKLRHAIEMPFFIDDNTIHISVSCGISIYPEDGNDSATLIRNADSALYRAKEAGRNTFSFYDYEITKLAASRMEVENALHWALDEDHFQLFYQPKIELKTGRVCGVEALLRLQFEDGRMIPPDEFIPIAEETGLIIPIGNWVLEQTVKQVIAWKAQGHEMSAAVNISAVQVQRGNIVQVIRNLLDRYSFNPSCIELEITESVLIDFPEKAVEVLNGVRGMGLSLALDDFGTGFSSLGNLKRYPFSTIKVDKSFVFDIIDDPNDEAITRAVVAMGNSLDMTVVAEGVESADHEKSLVKMGCHQAQGFYYARPLPSGEFEQWLNTRQGKEL